MQAILKYFPNLSEQQVQQFEQLQPLYTDWNEKVNVISRKDIDNLYLRHVLHSLAIAKMFAFKNGAEILDLGTGGGFPGIPLAILYPTVQFKLIDGTGKKIRVVNEIAEALGLKNVNAEQVRAEELKGQRFDFVITRAVARLEKLVMWSFPLIKNKQQHAIPNGLIAWKGGDISEEVKEVSKQEYVEQYPIKDYFKEEMYLDKCLVYVQG